MGGEQSPVPLTPSYFPSDSNECFQVHEGGCSAWGLYDLCLFQCLRALLQLLEYAMSGALGNTPPAWLCLFLLAAKLH